jgi:hypothetical protein
MLHTYNYFLSKHDSPRSMSNQKVQNCIISFQMLFSLVYLGALFMCGLSDFIYYHLSHF